MDDLNKQGFKTLQSKADELNSKDVKSLRGKKWSPSSIKRTYERWQTIKVEEESTNTSNSKSPKPE